MSAPARGRPDRSARAGAVIAPAPPGPGHLSVLARVALGPVVASYAGVVLLAAGIPALASGTTPGGPPGAAAAFSLAVPLWLAAHLVPLQLGGATLSALPLLPALLVGVAVAVTARWGVRRLGSRWTGAGGPVVAATAGAHAGCGAVASALLAPESVIDASSPLAVLVCAALPGSAALAAVAGPCGLGRRARAALPAWARAGIRAGLLGVVLAVAAGALLLTAALLADAPAVAGVFARYAPDAGSGLGLALLTLAYVPNAVLAAASWALGPGLHVGALAASPLGISPGPAPPLPLAAVLPVTSPPSWTGLVFALPLALGSLVGWRLLPARAGSAAGVGSRREQWRALGVAALTSTLVLLTLTVVAGGHVGAGPFEPAGVPVGWLALAVPGWVLVPGGLVLLVAVPRARAAGGASAEADDEAAGDEADDEADDEAAGPPVAMAAPGVAADAREDGAPEHGAAGEDGSEHGAVRDGEAGRAGAERAPDERAGADGYPASRPSDDAPAGADPAVESGRAAAGPGAARLRGTHPGPVAAETGDHPVRRSA